MKAIMLAAGVGRRLYGDSKTQPPKALLSFAGKTLLQRHVDILRALGVSELVLVVGFRRELIVAEARRAAAETGDAGFIRTLHNPRFRSGPILSLWTARDVLRGGDDILFMDADVLYHPHMLARLVRSDRTDLFLMDRDIEAGEDPVRICLKDGEMVEFGKNIQGDFDLVGEWPGFLRLSPAVAARLADACDALVDAGRVEVTYEVAMRQVLMDSPPGTFGVEDITGVPWIEIDFPSDLLRAEQHIQPLVDVPAALEDPAPPAAAARRA
ncbi:MAG: phosphocholine cytidylyltransferase family protein [Rhodobacterales bacterium]|nr:phosphocholine cytidylyltransferase family protein [Rhodobacterales bacterium]